MRSDLFASIAAASLLASPASSFAQSGSPTLDEEAPDADAQIAIDPPLDETPGRIVVMDDPPPPPPTPPDIGLGDCTFFPDPACPHSLISELGFGFGQNLSNIPPQLFVARTFLEFGYLTPIPLPDGFDDLHFGPVFSLAIETSDLPFSWVAGPRLRARYFVGGTHFVVEHSIGPQFQRFVYHDALETGTRVGFAADLSFGYRGIVGPWAELSALGDPGGNDGSKLQWIVGLRANLVGWAIAIGGITKAFGR